nr:hypothetical protein Iba_chr10cCG8460 [Ipomoea batatas]GMD45419.1 hypothetical protein Iba_chr10dCG9870 [Ipomoea batatas]
MVVSNCFRPRGQRVFHHSSKNRGRNLEERGGNSISSEMGGQDYRSTRRLLVICCWFHRKSSRENCGDCYTKGTTRRMPCFMELLYRQ